jgi:hypothetical protein
MATLNDDVLDFGLNAIITAGALTLHICSDEPIDRDDTIAKSLGTKAGPSIIGPQNGAPDGRELLIDEIIDGAGVAAGMATHWAIVSATKLLAAQQLTAPVAVTAAGTFYLSSFTIRIPDPL